MLSYTPKHIASITLLPIIGLHTIAVYSTVQTTEPCNNSYTYDVNTICFRAAAARGDMAVVQLLLSRGADITVADASLSTPFLAAVNAGHEAVAMLLLAQQPASVDLNMRVFGSNCALYCAAGEGLWRVTKALLQRGADCNVRTLIFTIATTFTLCRVCCSIVTRAVPILDTKALF
jgi:hypothetical protein